MPALKARSPRPLAVTAVSPSHLLMRPLSFAQSVRNSLLDRVLLLRLVKRPMVARHRVRQLPTCNTSRFSFRCRASACSQSFAEPAINQLDSSRPRWRFEQWLACHLRSVVVLATPSVRFSLAHSSQLTHTILLCVPTLRPCAKVGSLAKHHRGQLRLNALSGNIVRLAK